MPRRKKVKDPTKTEADYGTFEEHTKYSPYGMLCKDCRHAFRSCNHLPFNTMPVHKHDSINKRVIVLCIEQQPE